MITTTVGDILHHRIRQAPGHCVYHVFDGALNFYVGRSSRDVIARLTEHLDKSRPSQLGQLILLNLPEAEKWQIRLYTLRECEPYVQQKALFTLEEGVPFTVSAAEKNMITLFRTVVNKDYNPNPTPLPGDYKGHSIIRELKQGYSVEDQGGRWMLEMALAGWVCVEDQIAGQVIWWHENGKVLRSAEAEVYRFANDIAPLS